MAEYTVHLSTGKRMKVEAANQRHAEALATNDGHRVIPLPSKIAAGLKQHLQEAVGDIASDMLSPAGGLLDDKWKKRITKAKKDGVRDVRGWLADELYNDPDCIQDTIGDRLYDECGQDEALREEVLKLLEFNGHPAMVTACKALRQ